MIFPCRDVHGIVFVNKQMAILRVLITVYTHVHACFSNDQHTPAHPFGHTYINTNHAVPWSVSDSSCEGHFSAETSKIKILK